MSTQESAIGLLFCNVSESLLFNFSLPVFESLGLIELGGGSAQIAYIPEDPIYAGKMPVTIAGREYGVYCHSFLSYGATLMSERIAELLINENKHANVIINPCMLKGNLLYKLFFMKKYEVKRIY